MGATRDDFLKLPIATALRSRLCEPWRDYHTWEHPLRMLDHAVAADNAGVRIHDPIGVVGFCGWHDAVYDPTSPHGRNEKLSALLCEAEMPLIAPAASVIAAAAATRATITHQPVDPAICPDIALKLDIDLAILGSDEAAFDRYERGIHFEYAHVDAKLRIETRTRILRRFLERDRLYLTNWAHARWEAAARANLERSIRAMETTLRNAA